MYIRARMCVCVRVCVRVCMCLSREKRDIVTSAFFLGFRVTDVTRFPSINGLGVTLRTTNM